MVNRAPRKVTGGSDTKASAKPSEESGVPLLSFHLSGEAVSYDLVKEVGVDRDNIKDSLLEQPSKFAFIASAHAAYRGAVEAAKTELDQLDSSLYMTFRDQAAVRGEKVTERTLEALIQGNSKRQAALERLNQLKALEARLAVCVEAFRHRKDILISVTSIYRAELDMDLGRLKSEYRDSLEKGQKGD